MNLPRALYGVGSETMADDADVIIVGAGLSGLIAAAELAEAGKRIIVLDQEPEQSLGGQAFWSFGGIFLVNSPEQRRLRIRDSEALALDDWMGTAAFDRDEDFWPRQWAQPSMSLIYTTSYLGMWPSYEVGMPSHLQAVPPRMATF